MSRFLKVILILSVLCSATGCSYKNHLPPGEKLYLGADVHLKSNERVPDKKHFKQEAESVVRPKPNSKFLGMRLRLGIYNAAGNLKKKKGVRNWLKYKVGEPPVLYSRVNAYKTTQYIDTRLFNLGIFKVYTTYELKQTEKSVKVIYTSNIHRPYKIDSISWPTGDDDLNAGLREGAKRSLLTVNHDYNLDVVQSERTRLDSLLKNKGFFYFSPDYIQFEADTTRGERSVAITVKLKDDIPYAAGLVYRINDVFVYPDYSIGKDTMPKPDTVQFDNRFWYITRLKAYRPSVILKSVFIEKDDYYSRRKHDMTLNRVMGLGIFKYANIRYSDVDTSMPGFLNAFVYLSPLPNKSLRTEIDAVSKSNNYLGPQANLSFRNRNAFRGAELFVLNFHGTFETQVSGQYKGRTSYSFGPQLELTFPRFITPFNISSSSTFYQPRTRFQLGYDYLRRTEYFSLHTVHALFGYRWKESLTKEHELNPADIDYVQLSKITPLFRELLLSNPLLQRSYKEQFIAGASYAFTYNEQLLPQRKNRLYFFGRAETSGNLLSLAAQPFQNKKPNPEDPISIGGIPIAQFARLEIDIRDYYFTTTESSIALRGYMGVAKAYGNSDQVPYIRQFFSGGVNSVRAFRVHSLGPGTYREPDSITTAFLDDHGGDIKLEGNAEYRFPIYNIFKGAVFMDAGNIWLNKRDTLRPDGEFRFNSFMNEFGVGGGFGVRVDANFFVLRLDIAMPFRKPWLPENNRWVLDEFNFLSPTWRKDNIVFNIAIGYPF